METAHDICKANSLFLTADGPVSIINGGLISSYAITCGPILGAFKCSSKVNLVTLRAAIKFDDGANNVVADIYEKL